MLEDGPEFCGQGANKVTKKIIVEDRKGAAKESEPFAYVRRLFLYAKFAI